MEGHNTCTQHTHAHTPHTTHTHTHTHTHTRTHTPHTFSLAACSCSSHTLWVQRGTINQSEATVAQQTPHFETIESRQPKHRIVYHPSHPPLLQHLLLFILTASHKEVSFAWCAKHEARFLCSVRWPANSHQLAPVPHISHVAHVDGPGRLAGALLLWLCLEPPQKLAISLERDPACDPAAEEVSCSGQGRGGAVVMLMMW